MTDKPKKPRQRRSAVSPVAAIQQEAAAMVADNTTGTATATPDTATGGHQQPTPPPVAVTAAGTGLTVPDVVPHVVGTVVPTGGTYHGTASGTTQAVPPPPPPAAPAGHGGGAFDRIDPFRGTGSRTDRVTRRAVNPRQVPGELHFRSWAALVASVRRAADVKGCTPSQWISLWVEAILKDQHPDVIADEYAKECTRLGVANDWPLQTGGQ